ncbi:hypothetical protein AMJ57_02580 [Parcubacteria bacterium SG8_24]|nr:MAG: hypothetical protein AMJ57_02580 [Parcubacteria bacterium SG8_24]
MEKAGRINHDVSTWIGLPLLLAVPAFLFLAAEATIEDPASASIFYAWSASCSTVFLCLALVKVLRRRRVKTE